MNIKKAEQLIQQVRDVVGRWQDYAGQVGVEGQLMEGIGGTLVSM